MWIVLGILLSLFVGVIWGFVWIIKNTQFSKWKFIGLTFLGFIGLILGFFIFLTLGLSMVHLLGNPYYDIVGKVYTWADNSTNVYSGVFADTPDATKDKTLVPLAEVKIEIWEDSPNNVPVMIFHLISAADGTLDFR